MDILSQFHFLRPWALLLIPAILWIASRLWHIHSQSSGFEPWVEKRFLTLLALGKAKEHKKSRLILFTLMACGAALALAGPSWQQIAQPSYQSQNALVIVLDLSPSMLAEDIKPSRIVRARLKVQQLLEKRKDGYTALVVYAGEAFTVTPFTTDTRTIINLLPTLNPGLLPVPGSNIEMAIAVSQDLLKNSGINSATLAVFTDEITPDAQNEMESLLGNNLDINILGVGTDKGAPIPFEGKFLSDQNGNTVVAKRNSQFMSQLAQDLKGSYIPIQASDKDIGFIMKRIDRNFRQDQAKISESQVYDQWHDFGPTLLLFLLPLVALLFRRGWLLSVLLCTSTLTLLTPEQAYADGLWDSLWKNKNQRAEEAWQQQDYETAAELFQDKQWQASTYYKKGDLDKAKQLFAENDDAVSHYNLGNALAKSQQFKEAIAAYNQALALDPSLSAAQENKDYIEQLQQQQQEQQQEQQKQDDGSNSDQNSEDNGQPQNQQGQNNSQENQSSKEQASQEQNSESENQNAEQNPGEQSPEEQAAEQQQQSAQQSESQDNNENPGEDSESSLSQQQASDEDLSDEEQQALDQWLRKVPDDPSGLLRRKFNHEFRKRQRLYQEGKWELPKNEAHKRY